MNVLTSRVLTYSANGDETEAPLTVFMPFEASANQWKCGVGFDPAIYSKIVYGVGVDFIQAFVGSLKVARIYLETTKLFGRLHWNGMVDCGLPAVANAPSSLDVATIPEPEAMAPEMDVLTTRMLGHPNECGVATGYPLTIFVPFREDTASWKCGFTLGAEQKGGLRYGVGADFIEALLDGLAMARLAFEREIPEGWASSDDLLDCADLPVKIGRSFYAVLSGASPPVDPDVSGD